jgi:hypothetical protein
MLNIPRVVIVATITACAVVISGMSAIGFERYAAVRNEAQTSLQTALAEGRVALSASGDEQAALFLQIADADKQLTESAGKTLDESARAALTTAISGAQDTLLRQQKTGRQLAAAIALAERSAQEFVRWPPDQLATAKALMTPRNVDREALATASAAIAAGSAAVQVARTAWQAEQERMVAAAQAQAAADVAAEALARLARARTISPISTVTESGGATAPTAPAPPATPLAPVAGFDVEGYVLALAPNSFISWVDALCEGYYVCGRAWVGGVKSTPVKIELDPALRDIYANRIGLSVLVHESAHARQWLYYGADIISANEALTGLSGAAAVEYMADCATIGKLGYSTDTYTSSCTTDQLDAAALIW